MELILPIKNNLNYLNEIKMKSTDLDFMAKNKPKTCRKLMHLLYKRNACAVK